MPNWCENDLIIKGDAGQIKSLLQSIRTPGKWDNGSKDDLFDFDRVIPYPQRFKDQDKRAEEFYAEIKTATNEIERAKIIFKYDASVSGHLKDGYNMGGYDWCNANWGTKWSACETKIEEVKPKKVIIHFKTAWSPPEPIILALSMKWPALSFRLKYFERGMAYCGTQLYKAGEMTQVKYSDNYRGKRGG